MLNQGRTDNGANRPANRNFAIIAALSVTVLSGAAIAQNDALTRDPIQARSGSYILDPAHGKITWSVDHMGFSTYVG